jgi:glycosyltransferase involved in cell wall biosynthesis
MELRDGLRQRGHEARLFASTAADVPLPPQADYWCPGTTRWPRRILQVANPFAARALRRALRDFRPDVVHVRMFLTQLSPSILPLLRGVPALLHVGGYHTICPLGTRILPDETPCTFRAGLACRRQGCVSTAGVARTLVQLGRWRRHRGAFRLIVANSEALARVLRENDVAIGRIIRNGTPTVPPRPPLRDPPVVAFAGRLMPRKGADVLLDAMTRALPQVPEARLIVAGDGPDRGRIERLIAARSLGDRVTMCGHLSHSALRERLSGAWVQAAPSRYREPFSNAVAEAMMRGTAVVATDTGGTPELVRDGVTGFLVPPGDAAALADRLTRLLTDRDLAERLGAAARAFAMAELTVDRMLDEFEEVYAHIRPEVRGPTGIAPSTPTSH